MPIPSELILSKILLNSSNTGHIYPLKMRGLSEGISSWLMKGGVMVEGTGIGTAGGGTASGVLSVIPDFSVFSLGFKSNGLLLAERYYAPVVLGLSQLPITVGGVSVGVGLGTWSGKVIFSNSASLLLEIELGMLKNGVSGLYKGETVAWSSSISSLFLKGVIPSGTIQGAGSAVSASTQLTNLKVV